MKRRTNLVARERDDECIMVAVLFICFGMVLSEVMLRWRIAIDTNVTLDGVSILLFYDRFPQPIKKIDLSELGFAFSFPGGFRIVNGRVTNLAESSESRTLEGNSFYCPLQNKRLLPTSVAALPMQRMTRIKGWNNYSMY